MSKNATRSDSICLNCDHQDVAERFCPRCGQENVDTHQSFRHLTFHIVEDLTHYDGNVWRTVKNLLFHPARLTKIYLAGKRKKFVPPVKLYIFISFLTFFLVAVLPEIEQREFSGPSVRRKIAETDLAANKKAPAIFHSEKYATVKEFDSVQNLLPANKRYGLIHSYLTQKTIASLERNSDEDIFNKMDGAMFQNMPKAIFLYLPIFGFFLWLFHSKKRWYFFDHAIFTLHFFAFILLSLTIAITFLERVYRIFPEPVMRTCSDIMGMVTVSWIIVYFYIGHKRMYGESGVVSFIKVSALLFINLMLMLLLMIAMMWYSFVSI